MNNTIYKAIVAISDTMDYDSGPHIVTFVAGTPVVLFNLTIHDDMLTEGNKSFNLHIINSSLPIGVVCGDYCNTTIVIMDCK